MKNRKYLMVILTVLLVVLLAACKNSTDKSSADADEQPQNNSSSQNTNDDSSNVDSTEDTANTDNTNNKDTKEKVDTVKNEPTKTEDSPTNTTAGLKEEYLKKLNHTKTESDKMVATDTSTFSLKKVEDDRWDLWDALLNEVYGVLNEQLPAEEMEQLKQEQRDWIKFRDDSALEESAKYKGTTSEHLEYSAASAILTEERCYELVESYMQ